MFSSNVVKLFFLLAAASLSSCGWWRTTGDAATPPATFAEGELKSAIPFQTKEPENYRADFVVTTGGATNKIFAARRGGDWRIDFGAGENSPLSSVKTAGGKSFSILRDRKIYAETGAQTANTQTTGEAADFLIAEWLNVKANAEFTRLGEENGLTKYRVKTGDGGSAESLIFVDENLQLPVRQEFYSLRGQERFLTYTVEMRGFKPEAGGELFEVPADFKRVSLENLKAAARRESFDER